MWTIYVCALVEKLREAKGVPHVHAALEPCCGVAWRVCVCMACWVALLHDKMWSRSDFYPCVYRKTSLEASCYSRTPHLLLSIELLWVFPVQVSPKHIEDWKTCLLKPHTPCLGHLLGCARRSRYFWNGGVHMWLFTSTTWHFRIWDDDTWDMEGYNKCLQRGSK